MPVGTTRIDLGREYSSGINAPQGPADVGKLPVVNSTGLNFQYETVAEVLDPVPFQSRRVKLEDRFVGNGDSATRIGQLGWGFDGSAAASCSRQAIGNTETAGSVRLLTNASGGESAYMYLGVSAAAGMMAASQLWVMRFVVDPHSDVDRILRVGIAGDASAAASGQQCAWLSCDANNLGIWRAESCNGGAVETSASGINLDGTQPLALDVTRNTSGVWRFYVNGAIVGTHSTQVPTGLVSPFVYIESQSAGSERCYINYFGYASQVMTAGLAAPIILPT